jgi:uncharacterized protein (TIGR03437 family)
MRRRQRAAAMLLVWALSVSSAGAYYHFLHYTSKTAPYLAVPEKFDLTALPNKTITFFVSSTGPAQFGANDNLASVLSQIRQAARAWDAVATSDLRVAFGGLYTDGTPETTATGEVAFDDEIPPGLLAFTTHTTADQMVTQPDGSFFPITRSIIHLKSDLTQRPGPSYTDSFYLTVVHEMGHAMGLQHTFTSSVMSTAVTRATSALRPLDADDIAAISLLYPLNLTARTGTITGTVTSGNHGMHMASVVALHPNGSAISSLTNPDGTYRIDGIPPGTYFVYVQPLPPTANIYSPIDPDGNPVDPTGAFDGFFYPNARDVKKATAVTVSTGASTDGINFSVNRRNSVPIYDISTYSYFGQNGVHPAYVNIMSGSATLSAAGPGVGANGHVAPGLGVSVLGSAFIAPGGVRGYGTTPTYLALDLNFTLGASTGPQHFIFSQGSGLYVLPAGFNLVRGDPPSIDSVATDANGNVVVTGLHFNPDTRIYFDGLPALTNITDDSHATVVPPPGASNQNVVVTAFNSDGQNSMFLAPDPPPTFTYPASPAPKVTIAPSVLPAGTRAMIDIAGVNTNFVDGMMTVGLGSSDVLVRRIWVLSPTHALANVQIADNAQQGTSLATVISGFQVLSQPGAFEILTANPNAPVVEPSLINAVWLASGLFPGSTASLFGANLGGAQTKITINKQPATILFASASQVNLVIPRSLTPGPAILRLNNGAANAYPVVVSIDTAPPTIIAVENSANVKVDASQPAQAGDKLSVLVTGLADPGANIDPGRVHVTVGGVDSAAAVITQVSGTTYQVQFTLDPAVSPGAQVAVTISIDGKTSLPAYIPVGPLPAPSSGN